MNNFFNFNNIAYNAVDVSARLDNKFTNIHLSNEHATLDTLGLGATDGTTIHDRQIVGNWMPYPQSSSHHLHTSVLGDGRIYRASNAWPLETGLDLVQRQDWPAPHSRPIGQMSTSGGFFGCVDEMESIGAPATPIYPSSMPNTMIPDTQWQVPIYPDPFLEGLNMGYSPSSSSLAGALGREAGPHRNHTSRMSRYGPYQRAERFAVHGNEAGPSSQPYIVPGELAPVMLTPPPTSDKTAEADAEVLSATAEEGQDTLPQRKRHSRKSRLLLQAAMNDLKHELMMNWRCEPTHRSSVTEVQALRITLREIELAGSLPIHAEQILTARRVAQKPSPAKEKTKRAKQEKAKRDKVHVELEELSRYVPWPTNSKEGPYQHLVVQKALEILQGLPTRRPPNDA